jgi:hypothetical protein
METGGVLGLRTLGGWEGSAIFCGFAQFFNFILDDRGMLRSQPFLNETAHESHDHIETSTTTTTRTKLQEPVPEGTVPPIATRQEPT